MLHIFSHSFYQKRARSSYI